MDPLRIYDYLLKSRDRVFDAVRPLTPQQFRREFPIGVNSVGSTLAHLMVSEWYYIERFEERLVPPYEEWPIRYEDPPAFEFVEPSWRKQGEHIRALIAAQRKEAGGRGWDRRITWLGFPDDTRGGKRFHITVTAGDLLAQLALHEAHHRAQLMAMLREMRDEGVPIPPLQDLDYGMMMYERKEAAEANA